MATAPDQKMATKTKAPVVPAKKIATAAAKVSSVKVAAPKPVIASSVDSAAVLPAKALPAKAPAVKVGVKPVAKLATKTIKKVVAKLATTALVTPAAKPAARLEAKLVAKPAAKSPANLTANLTVKPAATSATKPAATSVTKPATKLNGKQAAAPAKATAVVAKDKVKKEKLVRDSFTMPESEYAVLSQVKKACITAGVEVKKSQLLRIGLLLLSQTNVSNLQTLIARLAPLKAGRPKKDK